MLTEPCARPLETELLRETHPARRYVPLLVWMLAIGAVILVPLSIISQGYLPPDDALRHAAKPISGKEWSQVLVLADWVKMDHNPGWHAILGAVHRLTHWPADGLVAFSIVSLFTLFWIVPLCWSRRPEAWLATMLIASVALPTLLLRSTFGRPLTVSAAVLMALLFIWRHGPAGTRPWKQFGISAILMAAAAWIHGSWYLFALPVAAFFLARQIRSALWLGAAWLTGTLAGALCTGHPIVFLWQAIEVVLHCFRENVPANLRVLEFWPSDGDVLGILVVVLVVIWRVSTGSSIRKLVNNPAFLLMALAWILGLKVARFWLDWGLPALLCWVAMQFENALEDTTEHDSSNRLALAAALAAAVVLASTSDIRGRWTASLQRDYISAADPELAGWFPGPGGILYNAQMEVFFRLFFKNPHGDWRYALGFEPSFMREDDLAVFRGIQKNSQARESFEPWVKKMRPGDRMVIERVERPIPDLEWKKFGRQTWIGRLPQPTTSTASLTNRSAAVP